jgi:hypothetical protein
MSQVSIPPVSARDGEPCPNCRAPLAGDQRYCLQCGQRRGDAPGTSLEALVAASAPGIAQTPGTAILPAGAGHVQLAPAPTQVLQGQLVGAGGGGGYLPPSPPKGTSGFIRSNGPFLSLGSLAVGVLIVGLLLGHWTSERGDVVAPTTTKIEITGLSAGAAAPAATTAADTSAADSSDAAADDATDDSAADTTPVAPDKDAVDATKLTPDEIEKAGKKGKAITTTGKKVPKDDKPAGGGSDFETIG